MSALSTTLRSRTFGLALAFLGLLTLGSLWRAQGRPQGAPALAVSACDLNRGACQVELPGGGRLTAEITPRPIPVLKPLAVRLTVAGRRIDAVRLEFSGVEMDMGFNQSVLAATDGGFVGTASLPVCVSGRMRWQAVFHIEGPDGRLDVPFQFDSGA